jgi:hypothetical protein
MERNRHYGYQGTPNQGRPGPDPSLVLKKSTKRQSPDYEYALAPTFS